MSENKEQAAKVPSLADLEKLFSTKPDPGSPASYPTSSNHDGKADK